MRLGIDDSDTAQGAMRYVLVKQLGGRHGGNVESEYRDVYAGCVMAGPFLLGLACQICAC